MSRTFINRLLRRGKIRLFENPVFYGDDKLKLTNDDCVCTNVDCNPPHNRQFDIPYNTSLNNDNSKVENYNLADNLVDDESNVADDTNHLEEVLNTADDLADALADDLADDVANDISNAAYNDLIFSVFNEVDEKTGGNNLPDPELRVNLRQTDDNFPKITDAKSHSAKNISTSTMGDKFNHLDSSPPMLPPKPRRYQRASKPTHHLIHPDDLREHKDNTTILLPTRVPKNKTAAEKPIYHDPAVFDPRDDHETTEEAYRDTDFQLDMHKPARCNCCSKMFLSSRKENRVVKGIFGIIVAIALGVALYKFFMHGYHYDRKIAGGLSCFATVVMSLCFAFSIKARCTGALVIPSLGTAQGRAAILSLIAGLLLMGPLVNITKNLQNVAENIVCTKDPNSTSDLDSMGMRMEFDHDSVDFVRKKLEELTKQLQKEEVRLRDDVRVVESFVNDLQNCPQLLQMCTQQMEYANKICDRQINLAESECQKVAKRNIAVHQKCNFASVRQSCKSRLRNICRDVPFMDDDNVQSSITSLRNIVKIINTDINITSYNINHTHTNNTHNCTDISDILSEKTNVAIHVFDVIRFIGKTLSLSLILLIIQSFVYLRHYLTKDTFDNCYITSYLKRLDANNRERRKPGVLPLRKAERRMYIDATKLRLSPQEKELFKHGLVTLCLHIVTGAIVCLFDYFLFWVLNLSHKQIENCASEITGFENQQGEGILSQTVALFTQFLLQTHGVHKLKSCIHKPHEPHFHKYYTIASAYLAALILVFTQAYFMRLRRKVVAYYYPERDTERNHYLLTKILRKRQNFTNRLTRNIQRTVRERKLEKDETLDIFVSLKKICVLFCWKVKQPAHCLVCDDVDSLGKFYHCATDKCHGIYCRECFRDVRNVCQLCFVHETV